MFGCLCDTPAVTVEPLGAVVEDVSAERERVAAAGRIGQRTEGVRQIRDERRLPGIMMRLGRSSREFKILNLLTKS